MYHNGKGERYPNKLLKLEAGAHFFFKCDIQMTNWLPPFESVIHCQYNGAYVLSLSQTCDFIQFFKDTSFLVEKWKIMSQKPPYLKNFWTYFFNFARVNNILFVTGTENLARRFGAIAQQKSLVVSRPPPPANRWLSTARAGQYKRLKTMTQI